MRTTRTVDDWLMTGVEFRAACKSRFDALYRQMLAAGMHGQHARDSATNALWNEHQNIVAEIRRPSASPGPVGERGQ